MFAKYSTALAGGALLAVVSVPAFAADIFEPQVIEAAPPPPVVYEQPVAESGGWYIRGDLGYSRSDFRGGDWVTPGTPAGSNSFTSGKLKGAWTGGVGVGYQITSHLRTDLTLDYLGKSNFRGSSRGACTVAADCISTDTSSFSAWGLLANAYVDIGTWHGITPYVGAGIGGAHIKWDTLANTACDATDPTSCDPTEYHGGKKSWRFSYALMAGASYCLTDKLKLDAGYRFRRIEGGGMFGLAAAPGVTGPGYDKGFNVHEGRAGLRYQFGGRTGCEKEQIAYIPEPVDPPIYK